MRSFRENDFTVQARAVLDTSPFYELREMQVERCGDRLLLSGQASSYYLKQIAQEAVKSVCSEVELVNSVAVDG